MGAIGVIFFNMKTWITYLAALFMGIATTLLFGDSVYISSILTTLSGLVGSIGILLFIPLVLIGFSAGVASLRKDGLGGKSLAGVISWSAVTAVLLPLAAALLFTLRPVTFPVSSTAGYDSLPDTFLSSVFTSAGQQLIMSNVYYSIATATGFILPIVILAWIFGYALKPNADVIKPAYMTINSFSEVMFRLSRTYTVFSYIIVYIASAQFFTELYQEKTVFVAPAFVLSFIAVTAILSLILLPLLYAIFTKGKRNPYRDTFRSLSAMVAGLTTSNILTVAPIAEATGRHSNGVQKRVAATTVPLYTMTGRAGTAAITTLSALALITSVTGAAPDIRTAIIIALFSCLASFTTSMATGFEVMFSLLIVFRMSGISLYGAEMTVLGLLPLVNGLAILLDAQIMMLGQVVSSRFISTDIKPPYKDIL